MNRRVLIRIALFGVLHFVAVMVLDSFIFLMSHLPPLLLPLDGVIVFFTHVHQFLHLPRTALRHLWWGEGTPTLLNWALTLLNSALWGAVLAWLTLYRRNKPRRNTV